MWHFWLFFWILLAVVIILMYCCLVRAGKMDDEMEKAFRKLNEKRRMRKKNPDEKRSMDHRASYDMDGRCLLDHTEISVNGFLGKFVI